MLALKRATRAVGCASRDADDALVGPQGAHQRAEIVIGCTALRRLSREPRPEYCLTSPLYLLPGNVGLAFLRVLLVLSLLTREDWLMPNTLYEPTKGVIDILTDLSSEDRVKVIHAALTLLGDNPNVKISAAKSTEHDDAASEEISTILTNSAVKAWVKKHKVSLEQLQHVFDFADGKAQPITLPGAATSKPDQTVNTYLIQGMAAFLSTGDPSFTDADARKSCENFGCYDYTNHTKNIKGFGNRITGSKKTGWKLTVPGLTAAAELVKLQAVAASS
jgi:hypothetical protein